MSGKAESTRREAIGRQNPMPNDADVPTHVEITRHWSHSVRRRHITPYGQADAQERLLGAPPAVYGAAPTNPPSHAPDQTRSVFRIP